MVRQMDLQTGRVLQALDTSGVAENTIVIFTSDNGGERYSDTWPFTGRKTQLLVPSSPTISASRPAHDFTLSRTVGRR
jgi:arylsulfatase A-like enzyme